MNELNLKQWLVRVQSDVNEQKAKRIAPNTTRANQLRQNILNLNRELQTYLKDNAEPAWLGNAMAPLLEYEKMLFKFVHPISYGNQMHAPDLVASYEKAKQLYIQALISASVKMERKDLVLNALVDTKNGYENLIADNPVAEDKNLIKIPPDLDLMIADVQQWPEAKNQKPSEDEFYQELRQPINIIVDEIANEPIDTLQKRINRLLQVNPLFLNLDERQHVLDQLQAANERIIAYAPQNPHEELIINEFRNIIPKKQDDVLQILDQPTQTRPDMATQKSTEPSGSQLGTDPIQKSGSSKQNRDGLTPLQQAMVVLDKTSNGKESQYSWHVTADNTAITEIRNPTNFADLKTDEQVKEHIRNLDRMLLAYALGRPDSEINDPINISGDDPNSRAILIELCNQHGFKSICNIATSPLSDSKLLNLVAEQGPLESTQHPIFNDSPRNPTNIKLDRSDLATRVSQDEPPPIPDDLPAPLPPDSLRDLLSSPIADTIEDISLPEPLTIRWGTSEPESLSESINNTIQPDAVETVLPEPFYPTSDVPPPPPPLAEAIKHIPLPESFNIEPPEQIDKGWLSQFEQLELDIIKLEVQLETSDIPLQQLQDEFKPQLDALKTRLNELENASTEIIESLSMPELVKSEYEKELTAAQFDLDGIDEQLKERLQLNHVTYAPIPAHVLEHPNYPIHDSEKQTVVANSPNIPSIGEEDTAESQDRSQKNQDFKSEWNNNKQKLSGAKKPLNNIDVQSPTITGNKLK